MSELDLRHKGMPQAIEDTRVRLDNFNERLSKEPKNVKKNKYAGNSNYVPIEQIENDLDKYFQLWSWNINSTKVIGNAVVVTGTLKVLNPVINQFIERSGIGAVPIEVKQNASPTDFTQINAKALQKNAPAAAAYAMKNAAKTLGNIFGRNINRDNVEFVPIHSTKARKEDEEKQRLNEYMDHHNLTYEELTPEQQKVYDK